MKINLSIPIEISENIDILNSSSDYYNDICYPATSDTGTDILLKDRKNEFIDSNKTICQEDCEFSEYNYDTKKAKCFCKPKKSSSSFAFMNINKTQLLKNFKDIKNTANIDILICYKKIFNTQGIFKNAGCLLIILIIINHIITIFIFYIIQFPLLRNKIDNIIFGIKNKKLIKSIKKSKRKRKKTNIDNNIRENIVNDNDNVNKNIINNNKIHKKHSSKKNKKSKRKNNIIKNNNHIGEIKLDLNSNNSNLGINSNKKNDNNIKSDIDDHVNDTSLKKEQNKKLEKVKRIMAYTNEEINSLSYNLAIENDKRTYSQYYISLLKTKHNLIFTFFNNDDYNSKIIKIDLFFIGFTIYYTVNALFFTDDTMHRIYINKGSYGLEYQIPIILYSSLISFILNIRLKLLALSNDSIIDFKQDTKRKEITKKHNKLIIKLRVKFIGFFAISFMFLILFWYYISVFGAVYKNTQFTLLKDTLISFCLSFIYPCLICLVPGIFRIHSLSEPTKNRKEYLYKFSKILQIF